MKFIAKYGYLIAAVLFFINAIITFISQDSSNLMIIVYLVLAVIFGYSYYREVQKRK